jgi:hypothetical protein
LAPELAVREIAPESLSTPDAAAGGSLAPLQAVPAPEPVESLAIFQNAVLVATAFPAHLALPELPVPEDGEPAVRMAEAPGEQMAASGAHDIPLPNSSPAVLEPVRTLFLAPPKQQEPASPIPMFAPAGVIQLEFYCERTPGAPKSNLTWCPPRPAPTLPRFAMKPILERLLEDSTPQKKSSKTPAFAEIFELPEAKKQQQHKVMRQAIQAVAAAMLVGAGLWFGVGMMKIGNQTPAINRDVATVDTPASAPESAPAPIAPRTGSAERAPVHRGPIARARAAIADRAASTVTDSFRNGMEAWGAASKQWAPGWSRHPDGYVLPGPLALFRPSVNYKDFHMEFFGQIESKSVGWAVRAHDPQNYYAMKFTVKEPGLRPVIAMVHYTVLSGKKSRPVEIPLNVMVHNNRPFQVGVDVRGNKLVTSIDGQEVNTWIDDTLATGGVGFFSDAGERARLYWMKISKNEDFLGRICAYVSGVLGDDTRSTAQLRPGGIPEIPEPVPPCPEAPRVTLAAENMTTGFSKDRRMNTWS